MLPLELQSCGNFIGYVRTLLVMPSVCVSEEKLEEALSLDNSRHCWVGFLSGGWALSRLYTGTIKHEELLFRAQARARQSFRGQCCARTGLKELCCGLRWPKGRSLCNNSLTLLILVAWPSNEQALGRLWVGLGSGQVLKGSTRAGCGRAGCGWAGFGQALGRDQQDWSGFGTCMRCLGEYPAQRALPIFEVVACQPNVTKQAKRRKSRYLVVPVAGRMQKPLFAFLCRSRERQEHWERAAGTPLTGRSMRSVLLDVLGEVLSVTTLLLF